MDVLTKGKCRQTPLVQARLCGVCRGRGYRKKACKTQTLVDECQQGSLQTVVPCFYQQMATASYHLLRTPISSPQTTGQFTVQSFESSLRIYPRSGSRAGPGGRGQGRYMTKGGLNSIFRGYNSDTEGLQSAVARGERRGNEIPTKPLSKRSNLCELNWGHHFLGPQFLHS